MCLQEVDYEVPRSSKDHLADLLADKLGMFYDHGLNVFLKQGAYGNATLSRFPILHTENLNVTWGVKKPRGCLMSRIETPAGEIAILNFHLGLAGFERIYQMKLIRESAFLEMVSDMPVIILGDSNDRKGRINKILSDEGFQDTWNGKKMHSFPSYTPSPLVRIDRIFYNNRLELHEHKVVRDKVTKVASDHLPVLARFQILPATVKKKK